MGDEGRHGPAAGAEKMMAGLYTAWEDHDDRHMHPKSGGV